MMYDPTFFDFAPISGGLDVGGQTSEPSTTADATATTAMGGNATSSPNNSGAGTGAGASSITGLAAPPAAGVSTSTAQTTVAGIPTTYVLIGGVAALAIIIWLYTRH